MSPRFDRIETEAELRAAQAELVRLAYQERRPPNDPERVALTEAIGDYRVRQWVPSR